VGPLVVIAGVAGDFRENLLSIPYLHVNIPELGTK
jgi:hypothetical protein